MTEEDQKKLLVAAKKALKIISVARLDIDFVFELRDLIRKCEEKDGVNPGRTAPTS